MKLLLRLLPQSLVERVFALYSIALLIFALAGLGAFYYHQFTEVVADAHESTALLSEVIAPTITDSAIIGDYDTVRRTLEKVLIRSAYASAAFIDLEGGAVVAQSNRAEQVRAPDWLYLLVKRRLFDVNRNISAGGRDYGVLRLKLSPENIAGEIWVVTRSALIIAAACFVFGVGLIRIPLRRWLGNLDRIRAFEWESRVGSSNPQELLSNDVPLEIRETFDVFKRTAASLQLQRARADVTLGAIADGVITVDSQGHIAYANPVAFSLFGATPESLLGQDLRTMLPQEIAVMFDGLAGGGASRKRIELKSKADTQFIIECHWTPISEAPGITAGYVLACRDVTEMHLLDLKLRAELESRRAALAALQNIVRELQAEHHIEFGPEDDILAVSRFIAELSRERVRVSDLLEKSAKELGYQKEALDQHAIVSITDAAGAITYVNEKFVQISGFSAEELIGQNHRVVKSGLHSAQFYHDLWETIRNGNVWHGQIANRSKSGEIYWVEATLVPWLDDNGLPYQYFAIRTDITRQKQNELALEEARRRELEIGTSIQRSLLQGELPEGIEGAWLAAFAEPSQVIDGDFYAIRRYDSGCFEVLVGDVMGKGVPAALVGAGIKTTYNQVLADLLVAGYSGVLPTPAEIVNRLHQALTPRLIGLASFATLALYRFDLEAGMLTYVNAGHTPGLLTRAHEASVVPIEGDNLPIGVMPEEIYVQSTVTVGPGDSLLVFSDGLTEARNAAGEEFGLERLSDLFEAGRRAALPPATLLHSIRGELRRFSGGVRAADDQTALTVQLHPRRRAPRGRIEQRVNPFLFTLSWSLEALATLRLRIEESASYLPEKDASALVLASFEAATNIIRHAPPLVQNATLTCRITRQGQALVVELIYPSEAFTPPTQTQPDFSGANEGGFGLYIIEQSVDSVEYGSPMPGIGSIRLTKGAGVPPDDLTAYVESHAQV